jgi:hypothetical protein
MHLKTGPATLGTPKPCPHARMRVVIEHENPRTAASIARDLRAAGHSTVVCDGPSERVGRECPLVAGRSCGLVEQADIVLFGLPLGRLRVFLAHRAGAEPPVVISLSDVDRARWPILAQLGPWVPRSLRGLELAQALERAADLGEPS